MVSIFVCPEDARIGALFFMKKKNTAGLFSRVDWPFYRTAVSLALPIAFQNLLTSCASLIDTAMVVGLGNAATSAMGVAARFSFLLNVVCFGFASGCSALLAQYWGARDMKNARRCIGFSLTVSLSFGLVYTVLLAAIPAPLMRIFTDDPEIVALGADYLRSFALAVPFLIFSQIMCVSLRAIENVYLPLLSAAASVVLNTGLNYCLIGGNFGFPALGLRGAALASAAGCLLQALIILAALAFGRSPLRGRIADFFAFSRAFCGKYIRIAFPALLNEGLWALGTNVYIMVFARQGTENHAGYTLYENVQQLFFVFFVGICGACSVMVGNRIGRGDREGGYIAARRFAVMTPLVGVVMGAALIAVRDPLLSLFPVETETARAVASACLLFYGFWIALRMIPYTLICGVFRAGGDTRAGCFFDLLGLWALGIPAVLLMSTVVQPTDFVVLVATMFIAEDAVKGVLCVRHFRSRRWIKQLTLPDTADAAEDPAPTV